jgi:hypothetical protein
VGAGQRGTLVAVAAGLLLLSYPVLNVPNRPVLVLGIPLLYVYIFVIWLAGIGVAWLLSRARDGDEGRGARMRDE